MKRIIIRSSKEKRRLFDTLFNEVNGEALIEVKYPKMNPMVIPLVDFVRQINEGLGKEIIIINTTER